MVEYDRIYTEVFVRDDWILDHILTDHVSIRLSEKIVGRNLFTTSCGPFQYR